MLSSHTVRHQNMAPSPLLGGCLGGHWDSGGVHLAPGQAQVSTQSLEQTQGVSQPAHDT